MESSVVEVIRYVSNISIIAPVLIFLFKLKIVQKHAIIIGMLVFLSALGDLIGFILYTNNLSTALQYNIYSIIQFGLLSWYYYESIFKERFKKVLLVGSFVYVVLFSLITLTLQDIFHYQNSVWILGGVILLIYSLIFGIEIHKNVLRTGQQGACAIMFNTGILFYFAWSTGVFIITEYLLAKLDSETMQAVWSAHNLGNISKNMFFAWGFYVIKNRD